VIGLVFVFLLSRNRVLAGAAERRLGAIAESW
jgi:hypothetical protein